jgi:hypothetical protein
MDLSPCTIQEFGANVKVAIFCDFLTKIGVFPENKFYGKILGENSSIFSENRQFFPRKYF